MTLNLQSANIENFPVEVVQPDGSVVNCFATGDEFYNWLHDEGGFTIIQNTETGWYVYGKKENGRILPSEYIVGKVEPESIGVEPFLLTDKEIIEAENREFKETIMMEPPGIKKKNAKLAISGTINNIVVYIRFSDDAEFTDATSTYTSMFNQTNANSMKQYFWEATYNQLSIDSYFYPSTSGNTVVSYQDQQPRGYYQPYSATNTIGYQGGNNGSQRRDREHILLRNAINAVNNSIPSNLNVDYDYDGYVDNVCFIVYGSPTGWASLLWPHMWSLYSQTAYINSKRVYRYNFQIRSHLLSSGNGVLAHEMYHTLGAPDLYHYSYDGLRPVWQWDLMERNTNPPQHMGSYMKFKYGNWISSIPEITEAGTYTLNPLTSSTNNCYKISSPNSATEYFVVEYRKKEGRFENSLPGSGLIIYRINPAYNGNASGPPDEVYVYRPNGTTTQNGQPNDAYYSQQSGRIAINNSSNPKAFLTNGSDGDLSIDQISDAGNTISFRVNFDIGGRPQLKTPPSGSVEVDLQPTLEWYQYGGAGSYIFQLSEVSDFTSTIVDEQEYTQTSYSVTSDLKMNTVYYWRVRAKVGSIYSEWSDVWMFTTARGIVTDEVTGIFCGSSDVTINFNASPIFQPGNFFIAQLSDTMGLFNFPTTLGSIQSDESGDLQMTVTIPDTIPTGYSYKFRVIGNSPVVNGSPTDDDYLITAKLNPVISDIGDTVCIDYVRRYYSAELPYLTYKWTILGGMILGATDSSYVDVIWDKMGPGWLKVEQSSSTGCEAFSFYYVEVIENPTAKFDIADTLVCAGGYGFYLANDDENMKSELIVEGGEIETIYSKYHIKVRWDSVGTGRIVLIQYNAGGCPDTAIANVNILQPPNALFDVSDTIVCGLSTISYSTSLLGNETCRWEIQNGTILGNDDDENINVKWNATGDGTVKLTVMNRTTDCEASSIKNIEIIPNPPIKINGKLTGCKGRYGYYTYVIEDSDSLIKWYVNDELQENVSDTLSVSFNKLGINTISLFRLNKNGCSDSNSISVDIFDTPEAPEIISKSDSIISSVSDGNRWYFNDALIPGEYSSFIVPSKSGKYSAKVVNADACESDMSNYIDFIVGSVTQVSNSDAISIYPTLTSGIINVQFNKEINKTVEININNSLGESIYNQLKESAVQGEITKIDISKSSQGSYILVISMNGTYYFEKIILIK